MSHKLEFEKLASYDAGKDGISIDVELRFKNESLILEAKVDTGATFCIFERRLGEKLGLDIESGAPRRVGTVVGSFLVFGHGITLITVDFEFDAMVYFAQDESFKQNVLGRHGWLDRVIIGINDYDGKLYLSRYEDE